MCVCVCVCVCVCESMSSLSLPLSLSTDLLISWDWLRIAGTGRSEICRAGCQAGNSGRVSMLQS